jgi:hypothetical protein
MAIELRPEFEKEQIERQEVPQSVLRWIGQGTITAQGYKFTK